MKTRAAILADRNEPISIEEVDLAEPEAGEVRVKIEACGICRSDLHAIDGNEDVVLPAVLGHEAAGVIEAVGDGIRTERVGESVILSWSPLCGECPPCKRGEVHLCQGVRMSTGGKGPMTWKGQGLDQFMRLGAFAEHVVVPESMAIPYPAELPATHACLIGCGVMTGFGAATKTAHVRSGETVVVLGCGAVGLAAIQGAVTAGATRIIAVDPIADRREAALRVGATDAVTSDEATRTVGTLTEDGADAVIECVGRPETMLLAFSLIRPGGRAIVVGLPEFGEKLSFPAIGLLTERSIGGSMYGSADPEKDFPAIATLHTEGRLDLGQLVTKVRPFEEINEGIAEMREGKEIRVVLTF